MFDTLQHRSIPEERENTMSFPPCRAHARQCAECAILRRCHKELTDKRSEQSVAARSAGARGGIRGYYKRAPCDVTRYKLLRTASDGKRLSFHFPGRPGRAQRRYGSRFTSQHRRDVPPYARLSLLVAFAILAGAAVFRRNLRFCRDDYKEVAAATSCHGMMPRYQR